MVDRQKLLDSAQKLLVRALDRTSPHEQRIAVRKLLHAIRNGEWQPHEIVLTWSQTSSEYTEIARLHGVILALERKVRAKEDRILELAAELQRTISKQSASPSSAQNVGGKCEPMAPTYGNAAWVSRVNELQIGLHRLEKQFGFGESMRLAVNHWYRGLPAADKVMGREAGRNWLRQHPGWEHGRLIPDHGRLRWRKHG